MGLINGLNMELRDTNGILWEITISMDTHGISMG
jgi:hypothetical protein